MGLFGFLKGKKKKNDGSSYEPPNDGSAVESREEKSSSKFIISGDIQRAIDGGSGPSGEVGTYHEEARTARFDSHDSVVFIGFEEDSNNTWACPECGTVNKRNYDGCAVCGLKNK